MCELHQPKLLQVWKRGHKHSGNGNLSAVDADTFHQREHGSEGFTVFEMIPV